jgi:peptidoglycan/LPS O-acetylase OafA/YrhL
VAIFFVLSGFLIFRPFAHSLIHGSPLPKTRNYYLKRAARILPGYWLALFILAGLDALTVKNSSGFLRNIFIVHPFTEDNVFTGIAQAWTLSVELSFYLVVPVFASVFVHQSRRRTSSVSVSSLLKALSVLVPWRLRISAFYTSNRFLVSEDGAYMAAIPCGHFGIRHGSHCIS